MSRFGGQGFEMWAADLLMLLCWGSSGLWGATPCPRTYIPVSGQEYGVRLSRWSVMAYNAAEDEEEEGLWGTLRPC